MDIEFNTKKLRKLCNDHKEIIKKYGNKVGRKLMTRLSELDAVDNLNEIPTKPPQRCKELIGDRRGKFSIMVDDGVRIVFKPNHDPIPLKDDGGINREKVTSILITEVSDYHD